MPKKRILSEEELLSLARDYMNGMLKKDILKKYHMGKYTLLRVLVEAEDKFPWFDLDRKKQNQNKSQSRTTKKESWEELKNHNRKLFIKSLKSCGYPEWKIDIILQEIMDKNGVKI